MFPNGIVARDRIPPMILHIRMLQTRSKLKTCASHSRYFSDELDALFFENKQNKCLQTILA